MIYAAVALALVMIWRATRIVNYAQGAMAMFTTYIALVVIQHGVPYWFAFVIALVDRLRARRGDRARAGAPGRVAFAAQRGDPHARRAHPARGCRADALRRSDPIVPRAGVADRHPRSATPTSTSRRSDCSRSAPCSLTMLVLFIVFQRTSSGCGCAPQRSIPRSRASSASASGRMLTIGWGLAALARRARRHAHRTGDLPVPDQHGRDPRLRLHRRHHRRP